MTVENIIASKLFNGDQFTALRSGTFSSSTTISLTIENPANSGKNLVIDTQRITTDSAAVGTYYRNPDISGGTASSAVTDNIGSGQTSVANVTNDATLSNADKTTTFPLSETGDATAGLAERPPILISEGTSISIEVESNGNDNDILILVVFYETERGA